MHSRLLLRSLALSLLFHGALLSYQALPTKAPVSVEKRSLRALLVHSARPLPEPAAPISPNISRPISLSPAGGAGKLISGNTERPFSPAAEGGGQALELAELIRLRLQVATAWRSQDHALRNWLTSQAEERAVLQLFVSAEIPSLATSATLPADLGTRLRDELNSREISEALVRLRRVDVELLFLPVEGSTAPARGALSTGDSQIINDF